MGFSAAKRKFWARKDQIRTRTLANLPSNQYIDIFPSARQTGFQQQITETFPVTGMRSPVRSIWKTSVLPCSSWHSTRSLLFGRKKATLWVLHTWIKLSRLLVFFFVFQCFLAWNWGVVQSKLPWLRGRFTVDGSIFVTDHGRAACHLVKLRKTRGSLFISHCISKPAPYYLGVGQNLRRGPPTLFSSKPSPVSGCSKLSIENQNHVVRR